MDFLLRAWIAVWVYLLVVVPVDLWMWQSLELELDFDDIGTLFFIDVLFLMLTALFVALW